MSVGMDLCAHGIGVYVCVCMVISTPRTQWDSDFFHIRPWGLQIKGKLLRRDICVFVCVYVCVCVSVCEYVCIHMCKLSCIPGDVASDT